MITEFELTTLRTRAEQGLKDLRGRTPNAPLWAFMVLDEVPNLVDALHQARNLLAQVRDNPEVVHSSIWIHALDEALEPRAGEVVR